ncbi:MAG: aminoacetone oxidase family FAD-binding enzyme, partial [Acidobacteriota bacterium]
MMHSQKFKKMFPKVYKSMGRDTEQGVVVVGGGAAGMAAALAASRQGATVTVLERMHRVGKKLLATGNGRCNFTNSDLSIDHYHGGNPQFILDVLNQFHLSDTLSFFEKLGVEPVVENDGYIYPASGQSSSVLDVLRYEMNRLGVEVVCDTKIDRVEKIGAGYQCRSSDGTVYSAASVILATGGKSYPNLGSNGSGLKIAERIGHKVREPFPALVQVVLDAPFLKRLSGLRIKGRAQSFINGKVCSSERGELLFTDYGLSGIPILQISRSVSLNAKTGYPMGIHLDLFPDTPLQQLASLISKRITHDPHKTIEMSFVGLLHKRLITVILKEAGFDSMDRLCG